MSRMFELIPRTGTLFPVRNMFDKFFDDFSLASLTDEEKAWMPAFDISENDKEYTLSTELPGIDIKDLDVSVNDGILSLKGEKKQEKEDTGDNFHRIERYYGSFHRSFRIPGKVDADKVEATYKDGVLKLSIPKAAADVAKKIDVKVN